jgi:hypothetical protein
MNWKSSLSKSLIVGQLAVSLAVWVVATRPATAQNVTNTVTAFDLSNYFINGQFDPGLTLQRGVTYVFQLSNLGIHPFYIKSSLGFGSAGAYNNGVINNGGTSGSVTFTVPANAPNTLFYQCGNHPDMSGVLTIVTPPSPPTVRIVHISIGDNIIITSTGTNGWSVIPEYKCDPAVLNWTPVPAFTNAFNNGTNVTGFNRLDPICGSAAVLIRVRNQQN